MFGEVAKLSPLSWKPVPNSSVYQPLHIQYFLISEKKRFCHLLHLLQTKCALSLQKRAYKAPFSLKLWEHVLDVHIRIRRESTHSWALNWSLGVRGVHVLPLTHENHCGLCIFRNLLHQLQVFTVPLRVMEMQVFLTGRTQTSKDSAPVPWFPYVSRASLQ